MIILKITKTNINKDLYKANKKVIRKYEYRCGLATDELKNEIACGDYFFESPDGQDLDLFYELKALVWRGEYDEPYLWKLNKNNIQISYSEGDIYLKEIITK